MKIHTGDTVKVISGKEAGTVSTVEHVFVEQSKLLVQNVNMVKKHMKKSGRVPGGIIAVARPIAVSRVMVVCPKCNAAVRVKYVIDNKKKYRVCRKCEALLDKKK